ncbi:LacI family DNA-binding transcriptional regulator [Labrys wisconsinensis]|uniref:DNA-binding LacI/PurR family transcriptional regulator n=1 Tax=Labrys wisconsinensis TaxID=425677 RepID=A0ABU0JGN2_9HYPH|nr:LacI family DNA-binding transcriptional regulator [Labrys wisconsinensis]MDQ0473456.1 DNA-binding LacI/PurR family transcriptional regulator [Labrys wisconsinensis]
MTDIARMAEVDISTVSRALANSPRVTEETKERIRRIVEETGYVVNHGARMLRSRSSNQILVLLGNIAATTFPEVVLGIEEAVQEHGYSVLVGSTHNDPERQEILANQLLTGAADGIILMTGLLPEVVRNFPNYEQHVVAVTRMVPDKRIPQVNIDNRAAMETAVAHLLALGHSRIVHLSGPLDSPTFQARAEGYRRAMRSAGAHPAVIPSQAFNIQAGIEAMERLLALPDRPTAIICASDEMAMGAISLATGKGIRVPDDMSFVGFDDIPFSVVMNPPLSTIHIPRRDMGRAGGRILLRNLTEGAGKAENVVLRHELIVRGSCGRLSRSR